MAGILGITTTARTDLSQLQKQDGCFQAPVTLKASAGALVRGQVMGQLGVGAAGTVTFAGTGNGTLTKDATTPKLAGVQAGNYTAKCVLTASNGGTFEVKDPKGNNLGIVLVGATFANQIKFVIADGSTDFVLGDTFTIPVAVGAKTWAVYDQTAVDGTSEAAGILAGDVADLAATQTVTMFFAGSYRASDLVWPSGYSAAQKQLGIDELLKRGIVVT